MKKLIKKWHLQLFNEGAAASSGEGTQAAEAAVQQTENAQGAQATAENQTEQTAKTPEEEFDELINGQYKDIFQNRTQKIIDKRFKETKNLEALVKKHQTINEAIAVKYGVDPNDTDALLKAVEGDESLLEEAAYKEGMTVEQYREKLEGNKAQRELAKIKAQQQQQQLNQVIASEEARIKKTYDDPSFSFWGEYNSNPEFKRMVDGRVPIESAYKVINQQKMIAAAEAKAVEQARKAFANDIIANGNRPVEGGLNSNIPAQPKFDFTKMTDEEMDKYIEDARQGKVVTFR